MAPARMAWHAPAPSRPGSTNDRRAEHAQRAALQTRPSQAAHRGPGRSSRHAYPTVLRPVAPVEETRVYNVYIYPAPVSACVTTLLFK